MPGRNAHVGVGTRRKDFADGLFCQQLTGKAHLGKSITDGAQTNLRLRLRASASISCAWATVEANGFSL